MGNAAQRESISANIPTQGGQLQFWLAGFANVIAADPARYHLAPGDAVILTQKAERVEHSVTEGLRGTTHFYRINHRRSGGFRSLRRTTHTRRWTKTEQGDSFQGRIAMYVKPALCMFAFILLMLTNVCCTTAKRGYAVEASLDVLLGTRLQDDRHAWNRDSRAEKLVAHISSLVQQYAAAGGVTTIPPARTPDPDTSAGTSRDVDTDKEQQINRVFAIPEGEFTLTLPVYRQSESEGGSVIVHSTRTISGNEARRTLIRNAIAYNLLASISAYHDSSYDNIYESTSTVETLVDWTVLALGGAGAFAAGGTSQILSGISAGVVGAKTSLSSNFLNDLNKFQVILKMQAIRSSKRAEILHRLTLPDSEYTLLAMALDMQDLYRDGTMRDAVMRSAQDAAADITKSLEDARRSLHALTGFMPERTP